ncbi:hypothetical protein GUJ93_ZPchr0012g20215 [Zizania palustris]|uniref:DUF4408 domain-containing protein n=1 Tax=Zizania palustris TaxID=103762 RepID=A0A8J6BSJ8_ZIZPA|nr:hypothetical protein GUJ93_ZPchr0012g20215 [Zizania palustris]
MRCSFLKAAAVAVVVADMAAKAAATSYISSVPLATGVLSSPRFLWVAANIIVVWLVSSYRRYKAASSAGAGAGNVEDMFYAMGMGLYPSSGHDVFALAAVAADLVDVAAPVATVPTRKQPREARPGKRRSTDRPRVRKVSAAGGETPRAVAAEAMPEVKKHVIVEDGWPSWAVAVTETELLACRKSVAATAGKPAIKKSIIEEDWLSWTVAASVAKPAAKKPVVEEEWLSWTMASAEVKPDVKKPIVEDEWSSWIIGATATKPGVKKPVVEDEWPVGWTVATTTFKSSVKKPVVEDDLPNWIIAATEAKADVNKPVVEDEWPSWTSGTAIDAKPADDKKPREWAITAAANPKPDDVDGDDVSMDSMWESILQQGARPVTIRKSDTWGSDEQPRLERAADTAVTRKDIRRSATATNMMVPPSPPHVPAPPAPANHGWRTREVLPAMRHDELMRRAESFIRRHHEQLRLQRQESEQRQALELQQRRHPAQLIRI